MDYIWTEAMVEYNNYIYASAMNKNGIYEYYKTTGNTKCVGYFSDADVYEWRLHSTAVEFNGLIYFLPDRSNKIHIFDPQTKVIESIIISDNPKVRHINGFIKNNKIFCIQTVPDKCIKVYSLEDKKMTILNLPDNVFVGRIRRDFAINGDYIYLVSSGTKTIVVLNTIDNTIRLLDVEGFDEIPGGFGTIEKSGNIFYLSTKVGIIKWNFSTKNGHMFDTYPNDFGIIKENDNKYIEIKPPLEELDIYEQPFYSSYETNDNIIFFPQRANMCLRINKISNKIEEFIIEGEKETYETFTAVGRITKCHYVGSREDEKICIHSLCTRKTYELDKNGVIAEIKIVDDELARLIKNKINYCEDTTNNLKEYIYLINRN